MTSLDHQQSTAVTASASERLPSVRSRRTGLIGTPLLLLGVALAATNLRPAVTSLASVLGEVRDDLGASATWASLITAAPTLCFGLAAFGAPLVHRRLGVARAIGVALAVLTVGLLLRVIDGPWVVLGGTVVAAAGIAVGNVLIPVVVKDSFGHAVGRVTGIYTAALATGGGIGAAFTPPVEAWLGSWRASLAAWAVLSAAALLVWIGAARHRHADHDAATPTAPEPRPSLLRRPRAWVITGFFGLQACLAYVGMGWLAELFVSDGLSRTDAGLMLAVLSLIGIPLNLIVPTLALHRRSQSVWIVGLAASALAGVIGLAVAPTAAPLLWTVLFALGLGAFPIGLGLIGLRTQTSAETAALSAMAQGGGYLFGALGLFVFGLLHALTGVWTPSLVLLAALILVQMVLGWFAGRPRWV